MLAGAFKTVLNRCSDKGYLIFFWNLMGRLQNLTIKVGD